MSQSIGFNLLVSSYDAAIDFYCNTLGLFRVAKDTGPGQTQRFVYLQFHDMNFLFGLYLTRTTARPEQALVGKQAEGHVLLILPVNDCEQLVRHLRNTGARVDGDVINLPYAKQAICFDCFGNRISLVQSFHSDWE